MRTFACRHLVVWLPLLVAAGCQNSSGVAGVRPYANGPYAANSGADSSQPGQVDSQIASMTDRTRTLEDQLKNARTHARLQDEYLRAVNERLKQATTQLAQLQGSSASGGSQLDTLDRINQEKERQLAAARQDVQRMEIELSQLRKQIKEKDAELADVRTARDRLVSSHPRGAATITPNSSAKLELVTIPGIEVRRDGDVIRIPLPAEQIFEPGTVKIRTTAQSTLDQVALKLAQAYPFQRIGVEGHATQVTSAGGPWRDNHHLSSAEAMAVYEYLSQRSSLREDHFHIVGHGANHPVYSTATDTGRRGNQRVEVVIYPDRAE